MARTMEVQEFAIAVVARNQSPMMLNVEFLKCSGMVPQDWELARQPVCNPQMAQIVFQNGVAVMGQADCVLFVEGMTTKTPQDIQVAQMASQYIDALPQADYQSVGINLRGFVPFNSDPGAARQYLTQQLMAAGDWQTFGKEPMRASLNLAYALERGQLYVTINEAALQLPEGATTPIVLFSGNFEYSLTDIPAADRPAHLKSIFAGWQTDLEIFNDLINNRFLAGNPNRSELSLSLPETLSIS